MPLSRSAKAIACRDQATSLGSRRVSGQLCDQIGDSHSDSNFGSVAAKRPWRAHDTSPPPGGPLCGGFDRRSSVLPADLRTITQRRLSLLEKSGLISTLHEETLGSRSHRPEANPQRGVQGCGGVEQSRLSVLLKVARSTCRYRGQQEWRRSQSQSGGANVRLRRLATDREGEGIRSPLLSLKLRSVRFRTIEHSREQFSGRFVQAWRSIYHEFLCCQV